MAVLRFALRQLRRDPAFTCVAVLTIAVGIAVNTTLFSVYDALILRPLTLPRPDELVRVWTNSPRVGFIAPAISWTRFELLRDRQTSFAQFAGMAGASVSFQPEGGDPEQLTGALITPTFFETLDVRLAQGRTFDAEEDKLNGPAVAILSHEFWQARLGGRADALGSTVRFNGEPHLIVGIAPPRLSNPFSTVQVFLPRAFQPVFLAPSQIKGGASYLQVTARLTAGMKLEQATAEIVALGRAYAESGPERIDAQNEIEARTFVSELVGDNRPVFRLLLGAVGAVLLIACANVSNLYLGRLAARAKEVAVRLAMGASRGQLIAQFLAESLVLAFVAGVLGLLLAEAGLLAVQRFAAEQLSEVTLELDAVALAFTAGLSALCAGVIGFVPAWQATRGNLVESLKDSARGSSGGMRAGRFRSMLIVTEVALSVVLLVGAGLLVVSFLRLQQQPAGFNASGVASAFVSVPPARYKTLPAQMEFHERVVERLRAMPGVESAASIIGLPLSGFLPVAPYAVAGRPIPPVPERKSIGFRIAGPDYFQVMQVPLRAGRLFTAQDRVGAPLVCIVNEEMARAVFPNENPLGQRLIRGSDPSITYEIVGVVGNMKSLGLGSPPPQEIYFSALQAGRAGMTLVARTAGDPASLQAQMRAAVAAVDPIQPIATFRTMEHVQAASLGFQRLIATLTMIFAGIALLMAAIGLYSVLAYLVGQRTAELGVRMALGAQRGQVLRLVLGQGMRLVVVGVILGIIGALAGGRLIRALLHGVEPSSPAVILAVALGFLSVALAACLIPAWRATRVDPLVALRRA